MQHVDKKRGVARVRTRDVSYFSQVRVNLQSSSPHIRSSSYVALATVIMPTGGSDRCLNGRTLGLTDVIIRCSRGLRGEQGNRHQT